MSSGTPVRVLSIDGGGIRGLIPAIVLEKMEKQLTGHYTHPEHGNLRLADMFDVVAGTSTGGILACMYLLPDVRSDSSFTSLYPASAAPSFYEEAGPDIFHRSLWRRVKTTFGLFDERYPADALEDELRRRLPLYMGNLVRPCILPTYDINNRRSAYFRRSGETKDVFVWKAARATAAAPTYFSPMPVGNSSFIDGAVVANDPAMAGYVEARKLFGDRPVEIVSVGTGQSRNPIPHLAAKNWGLAQWAQPILDILTHGPSEVVQANLRLLEEMGDVSRYLRINDDIDERCMSLDDASDENLARLRKEGNRIKNKFSHDMAKFVAEFLEERD